MLETTMIADSPRVIHFVDVAHMKDELRPVCGAWGDEVTWTTLVSITTCPACALSLARKPSRRDPLDSRRSIG